MAPENRTGEFFLYLIRAYPLRTGAMVALLSVGGLLEGIGLVTLLPLLEIALSATGGNAGPESGVGRALLSIGINPTLPVLLSILIGVICLKALTIWLAMRQAGYAVGQVTLDLRLELIQALMKARWRYFGFQPIGQFATTMGPEGVRAATAYREACAVLSGVIQTLVYLLVAAFVSWQMTILAILASGAAVWAMRGLVNTGRKTGQAQTRHTQSMLERLMEALQGMRAIKVMANEDLFYPLLRKEVEDLNVAHRRQVAASEGLRLINEPVVTIMLGIGLWVMIEVIGLPFTTVLMLAFLFYRIMVHVNSVQMRYQITVTCESAFWSIRRQIDAARSEEEYSAGSVVPEDIVKSISLRNVTFSFGERLLFRDISMEIPAGSFTAVIGPSGSGKTTLADLISGLHRPDSGEVYIDDVPLSEIDLRGWRRLIGYVPQDVFLFNDTVRRNVTMGEDRISDAEVEEALRAAGAWDFIAERGGLDFKIAPQGTNLSGGQRQRLAIARALVRNPSLLVLDEATTALDARTEAEICETLRGLRGRVTIFAISHQAALRDSADCVHEVHDASLVPVLVPAI